jgi:hypothetical protein
MSGIGKKRKANNALSTPNTVARNIFNMLGEYIIENSNFTINNVNNIMRRRNVIQMTRMFTLDEKKLVKQRLIQLAVYYKSRR